MTEEIEDIFYLETGEEEPLQRVVPSKFTFWFI